MSGKSISWILEFTSKLPNDEEKIKCLRANESVMKPILNLAFNPDIKWLLPEDSPPYRPNHEALPTDMYKEMRKMYIFLDEKSGGNPRLNQIKRESLFIDVLESVPVDDAKLLLEVKNKKIPFKGITKALVKKAFPGMLR